MTAVIFGQASAHATAAGRPAVGEAERQFLISFLTQASPDPLPCLEEALAFRAADPYLTPEEIALLPAVRSLVAQSCPAPA